MAKQDLVIVDTGCANIASVKYAFERLDASVTVSDNAAIIHSADKVLLPGVGSATAAMNSIKDKGLDKVITSLTQPVLGICLGMQLLSESSKETPVGSDDELTVDCLSLIPTHVRHLQSKELVLPHMGWNQVSSDHALFEGIPDNSYFYFVHSFCAPQSNYTIATSQYGEPFSAAIANDNFMGVQFHPERSGQAGSQLLKNFIQL